MDQPILEYVKAQLESRRGKWKEISEATGVPYFTITNMAQGKVEDPRISTVQALYDYFRAASTEEAA